MKLMDHGRRAHLLWQWMTKVVELFQGIVCFHQQKEISQRIALKMGSEWNHEKPEGGEVPEERDLVDGSKQDCLDPGLISY